MKELFSSSMPYIYLASFLFLGFAQDAVHNYKGNNDNIAGGIATLGLICKIANIVLAILACCILPSWWMGIVLYAVGLVVAVILGALFPRNIWLGIIGIISAYACTIISYCQLYSL